jgi:hypothetical protein
MNIYAAFRFYLLKASSEDVLKGDFGHKKTAFRRSRHYYLLLVILEFIFLVPGAGLEPAQP